MKKRQYDLTLHTSDGLLYSHFKSPDQSNQRFSRLESRLAELQACSAYPHTTVSSFTRSTVSARGAQQEKARGFGATQK